jgi:8-oxo-dGTP pyrophosphatase MutT (NUDIX family)
MTVAAVVEREGRFLLVEELIDGQLVLNQPAGHVEDRESLLAAVMRETLEETAWEFQPEAVVGVYRWRHPDNQETFIRVCFSGIALRQQAGRTLDEGISGTVWLNPEELVRQTHRHRSPLVQRCVLDYLHGRRYPLQLLQDVVGP